MKSSNSGSISLWWQNTPLLKRTWLVLGVIFVLSLVAVAAVVPGLLRADAIKTATANAEQTVLQFKILRKYYVQNVINKINGKQGIKASYDHEGVAQTIPLPATLIHDISELLAERGINIKLYSPYPFPNRANRATDEYEKRAWEFLTDNPDQSFTRTFDTATGLHARIAVADTMVDQSCVDCHNSHPETPKVGWAMGDLRGVLEVETDLSAVLAAGATTSYIIIGLISLLALVVLTTVWLLVRDVTKQLGSEPNELKQFSESIAAGHLQIDSLGSDCNGALGSLQEMKRKLANIIARVFTTSDEIQQASVRLESRSESMMSHAHTQAAALVQSSASIKQFSDGLQDSLTTSQKAKDTANNARSDARDGEEVVNRAKSAMSAISEASKEIVKIINVMNEISFQTNLLAINASVEAARAGDSGRGFAVVATEVQKLAGRSSDAAKEIRELIDNSVEAVSDGARLVGESGDKLLALVGSIESVDQMVTEIFSTTELQVHAVNEMEEAINEIDTQTQKDLGLVEENAAASDDLQKQAENLREIISFFKLGKV